MSESVSPFDPAAPEHTKSPQNPRSCFIVFSSRLSHVDGVVNQIADQLSNELKFDPIKLDEARVSGKPLLGQLIEFVKACDLGVVILDGMRPNVVLELGMLLACNTPTVILKERNAFFDLKSLHQDLGKRAPSVSSPILDISKHLSDISNLSWNAYSPSDHLGLTRLIRTEVKKLDAEILKRAAGRSGHRPEKGSLLPAIKKIEGADRQLKDAFLKTLGECADAIKDSPAKEKAHFYLHVSEAFFRRKETQEALRFALRGLELDPTDSDLIFQKADLLNRLGHGVEAVEYLAEKNRYKTSLHVTKLYLGLLVLHGKASVALKLLMPYSYEELIAKKLISLKAEALTGTNRHADAIALFLDSYEYDSNKRAIERAINIVPSNSVTKLPAAMASRFHALILRALQRKHIQCFHCLYGCAAFLGWDDLQEIALTKAKSVSIDDRMNWCSYAGYGLVDSGLFERGYQVLMNGLKRKSSHSYLNASLGFYYYKAKNDYRAGNTYYERAQKLRPKDLNLRRMAYLQKGLHFLRNNKFADARKWLSEAQAVNTDYHSKTLESALKRVGGKEVTKGLKLESSSSRSKRT